ncbi:MAG: hypothetical protein NDI61_09615 [Bdellovibrionaceae bacterium]|nr:hypothetical protein [Pseudobdellovibrionaceae bacterium]
MGDIIFAIRMLVITVVIVVLMQIKLGDATLETHAHQWMRSSAAVEALQDVSKGAVKAMSQGYQALLAMIDRNVGGGFSREQMAGSRSLGLGLERSAGYEKDLENKRRAADHASETSAGADSNATATGEDKL